MLKSYEAIYENGEIVWLVDRPSAVHSARVVGVFCINPRKGGFWKLTRRGLG